jgi:hypothetical protein
MKLIQTQQYNDDVILRIVVITSVLFTLFTQFIQEIFQCFTLSPKKLPQPSVTNPSIQKKGKSSTRQRQTSKTPPKVQSPAPETSTETRMGSSAATGFQPEVTTPPKKRTRSRAGTTSQPTKRSRSGHSTVSASHPVTTK